MFDRPSSPKRPRARRWATYRRIVQISVLALAFASGIRHLYWKAPSAEAYCPFGAIETAWSVLAGGSFLRNLDVSNGIALAVVLLSALFLGRIFCGWMCPIGTLSDGLAWISRKLFGAKGPYPWEPPRWLDRALRWLKVVVLLAIIWASITAVAPPLAPFCPYRTLFDLGAASMLSWGLIAMLGLLSLIIERFWCRYLCPLGLLLAPLNWISPWRPQVDHDRCVHCGLCQRACPMGIDPVQDGTDHLECVRCYACVDACRRPGAMAMGEVKRS